MTAPMTMASDMIAELAALDPDLPLGFASEAGEIGGGYHITELKLAQIRSIDCGGRESQWVEAQLQLLDGSGGAWITAGKVAAILRRCVGALPDLADAPLSVEFAHGNRGLSRYTAGGLEMRDGRAVVPLVSSAAQCKPAVDMGTFAAASDAGCCGASKQTAPARCCG